MLGCNYSKGHSLYQIIDPIDDVGPENLLSITKKIISFADNPENIAEIILGVYGAGEYIKKCQLPRYCEGCKKIDECFKREESFDFK